jgi:hypothetical protein
MLVEITPELVAQIDHALVVHEFNCDCDCCISESNGEIFAWITALQCKMGVEVFRATQQDLPLSDNKEPPPNPHTHCVKCGVAWRDTAYGLDQDGLCHDCYRDKEDAQSKAEMLPPIGQPSSEQRKDNTTTLVACARCKKGFEYSNLKDGLCGNCANDLREEIK